MTEGDLRDLAALIKPQQNDVKRWLLPVLTGLSIAFVGWFASKSSSDIENNTTINKTLEFMQVQQATTNAAINDKLDDMERNFELSIEKINDKLGDQFTREDFNREMIYRDQDTKRMRNQVEEIFDKVNK